MRRDPSPPLHEYQAPPPPPEVSPIVIEVDKSPVGRVVGGLLRKGQEEMIFNPHPPGLEKLKSPSEYPQLQGMDIRERVLVSGKGKYGEPDPTITVWEKQAEEGKKHYIIFTGKTGHIADTGALPEGVKIEGYDRHAGLTLLQELAREGAGFTVVTMRGYGNNAGAPSEEGFRQDVQAFRDDWKARVISGKEAMPPLKHVVVAGVSLGTTNATYLSLLIGMDPDLRQAGDTPPGLTLVNPPKRFSAVADHVLQHQPLKHKPLKWAPFKSLLRRVAFKVGAEDLDAMLRHHFRTDETLAQLDPNTKLLIMTSALDKQVPREHSTALMEVAEKSGLHNAHQVVYEHSGHLDIPVRSMVHEIRTTFEKPSTIRRALVSESEEERTTRLMGMRHGVETPSIPAPKPGFIGKLLGRGDAVTDEVRDAISHVDKALAAKIPNYQELLEARARKEAERAAGDIVPRL